MSLFLYNIPVCQYLENIFMGFTALNPVGTVPLRFKAVKKGGVLYFVSNIMGYLLGKEV
jgi:hypothetical protein